MSLDKESFQYALEEIRSIDRDLFEEVQRSYRPRAGHEGGRPFEEERTACSEVLGDDAHKYRNARPVLTVKLDELELVSTDAESELWQERLRAAGEHVARAVHATGRVELIGNGDDDGAAGTAFLVAPDIIATNQHVASAFAQKLGVRFKINDGGDEMEPSIDFFEEKDVNQSLVFDIVEVLHLEHDEHPDVAFLRIAPRGQKGEPLPGFHLEFSAGGAEEGEQVVAVGYPARDVRKDTEACMLEIFGNVFDKKRVSPGQIRGVTSAGVQHDCSVLRNNSGSAVVSLKTGKVVGIHYTGEFLKENFAVPAADAQAIFARLPQASAGHLLVSPGTPAAAVQPQGAGQPGALAVTSADRPGRTRGRPRAGTRSRSPRFGT